MESVTLATYRKFNVIKHIISDLRVRDKRSIFLIMRTTDHLTPNTFFPSYGYHCRRICGRTNFSRK